METKKEVEIKKEEIAQALTHYIGGELEVSEKVSPEEAGMRGTYVANITEVAKDYAEGKVSLEEAEKRVIEETVSYTIAPAVEKIVGKGVDLVIGIVTKVFSTRIPIVAKFLELAKPFIKKVVKNKLIKKTVEFAQRAWNKAKAWIKSIF